MVILFLGNFAAHHSSENYYLKTLTEMGHQVICLQEGKAKGEDIISASNRADVSCFFWVRTHGWQTPGIVNALENLRSRGIVSFGFHLDLYMGLQRWKEYEHGEYFKVDHFFTVDKKMADWLNGNTNTVGHFMPAGVYEGECGAGIVDKIKYPHDIVFTGARGYHPEWNYRPKLIDWLKTTYGERFGHYGNGGLSQIRGTELNNLYSSTKIVIGDTLCKGFDYPFYSSDRLFECSGRNAFLIYPRIYGLDMFYQDKREIVYYDFNQFDQLKSLIDYYLVNDEEREQIRTAALWRTKEAHTYRHRFETIFQILNLK